MSEFILASLRDIVSQLDKLEETKEIRALKLLANVLIDRISKDENHLNTEDTIIETISNDIELLKTKGGILTDYRFWGIVSTVIFGFCTLFWSLAVLKLKEDLGSVFVEKRYEKIIEANSKQTLRCITNETTIEESKLAIKDLNKRVDGLEKEIQTTNSRNDLIHTQIWNGLKEKSK